MTKMNLKVRCLVLKNPNCIIKVNRSSASSGYMGRVRFFRTDR